MKLDILAFGAHPDDVELSCSGTLLKHISKGMTAGIIDLTAGELGTRGNAELRAQEAQKASAIIGISARENLGFKDGFFSHDEKHLTEIVKMIRKYKPEIVLCNAVSDRHPDHGRASKLVSDACFLSGLIKINTTSEGEKQEKWRPKAVYFYIQDHYLKPDFIVDITEFMDKKMQAVLAFSSQFHNENSEEPQTPISSPEFLDFLYSRAEDFGRPSGAKYAEGFNVARIPEISDLFHLK